MGTQSTRELGDITLGRKGASVIDRGAQRGGRDDLWLSSLARGAGVLRGDDLFEGGRGHAGLPGGVAQLQAVAARVVEVELAAGEEAAFAVDQAVDLHTALAEQAAAILEAGGVDRERVVQGRIDGGAAEDRLTALAEEDIVAIDADASHRAAGQPAAVLEA